MKLSSKTKEATSRNDRISRWIASSLMRWQRGFATLLATLSHQRTPRTLKKGLYLFCVIFGGYSCYVLVTAIGITPVARPVLPATLSRPNFPQQPLQANIPFMTPRDLEGIARFRNYIDSLRTSPGGRATYDSFIRHRPLFLDSLELLERFYYSTKK